jgi:hypothetical protein
MEVSGVGTAEKSTPRREAAIERMIIEPTNSAPLARLSRLVPRICTTRGWMISPSPVAGQDPANLWLHQ